MVKWHKVEEAVALAPEIDISNREAWLADFCAGDLGLKNEIESLLAFETEIGDFLERSFSPYAATILSIDEKGFSGKQFGHYRIIREIGRGGMGAVFLAERSDGAFDQQVALKIIRQTLVDKNIERRFLIERQILANLNHPNIARLLDGGFSKMGEPFFVMEFVDGEPITKFASRKNLNLHQRLQLFLKVCSAVAYAHRNLVVHRDLKPGNILVAEDGEPKLLDFGLAKIIDVAALDNEQTRTVFHALTPAYASPEQLRGEIVTTETDIYSLGVVLYELLADERPFHFDGMSLDQIIKTISESEPLLPSVNPHSALRIPQLKGDLDNIVLMALRKEPERRYQSVEVLAGDIQRHLKKLPVSARPNTYQYRASKFVRRHKVGVFAASLIFLSIISGIIFGAWQARQTKKEKEKAEAVNAFLIQTLKYSDPILSPLRKSGQETTVTEVLDEAARRLDSGEFDASPELKAELENTVGTTYIGQGKYNQAAKHFEQYVQLLRGLYGDDHPKMIAGSIVWAGLLFYKGEIDEAEKTFRRYLPLLKTEYQKGNVTAETLANALNNVAYIRRTQGDSKEAESLFRETLGLIPKLSAEEQTSVATTRSTLASTIGDQGRFDEALNTAREAVDEYRTRGDVDSPSYGFSLTVLGGFLTDNHEYSNADTNLKEAENIFRKLLSQNALWLGDNLRNQGVSLYWQGKYDLALVKIDEAQRIYLGSFGTHYDHYPTVLIFKGLILTKTGKTDEGERLLREAVKIRAETLPSEHFWTSLAGSALGECLTIRRRFAEAEPLLQTSFESINRVMGPENPNTVLAYNRLQAFYSEVHKPQLITR